MSVFNFILTLVLALTGMDTLPLVAATDTGLAFYSIATDTVRYNQKDYPCEKNVPLCIAAIAHEVGGHRYALTHCVGRGAGCNNEEFAYLEALNVTAQLTDVMLLGDGLAVRANQIAYAYWWNWQRQYAAKCHAPDAPIDAFSGC